MNKFHLGIDINKLREDILSVMQRHSLSIMATAKLLNIHYLTLRNFLLGRNNIHSATIFAIKNFIEKHK